MARPSTFLLTTAIHVSAVCVEAQVAPSALDTLAQQPDVKIVVASRPRPANGALGIRVKVTNLTPQDMFVESIRLELPGEVMAFRSDRSTLRSSLVNNLAAQLKPGQQRTVSFFVPHYDVPLRTPGQLLTFFPGEYELQAVVVYRFPPGVSTDVVQSATLALEPPLTSVLWGGVVGAVLLGAFLAIYQHRKVTPPKTVGLSLLNGAWIALAGAATAVITLLLLRRLDGVDLPVKITITDFYGGIVIGLFSFKLAKWLYERLAPDA